MALERRDEDLDNFISTHNEVHGAQDSQRIFTEILWIPVRPRSRSFLAYSLHMRPHVYVHTCTRTCPCVPAAARVPRKDEKYFSNKLSRRNSTAMR